MRCAVLVTLLFAMTVSASTTTSAIRGRVTIGNQPAANVTVTATSAALLRERTTITHANGTYWLGELPPGEYDVTFAHTGTTTLTRRAIVELGRVARADAKLEINPEEESVTSTATTPNVSDTTAITSHFDDHMLDRLPLPRAATPGLAPGVQGATFIDGMPSLAAVIEEAEETIEQTTVVRGAAPVEDETRGGSVTAMRTRSGSEQLLLSLRDTLTNPAWVEDPFRADDSGVLHRAEATAGGRLIPEHLWFFAAGWTGDDAILRRDDIRGFQAKVDAQLGPSAVTANYIDSESIVTSLHSDNTLASLTHTIALGPNFTSTVMASRTKTVYATDLPVAEFTTDFATGRASYVLGDHVLTAGVTDSPDATPWFAADRWSVSRWTINAGARYDHDQLLPRVAVTWDLRGNGARAISAGYGEYHEFPGSGDLRIANWGIATVIGNSGSARIDVLHRDNDLFEWIEVQADVRYRLFDRFEAGATYTFSDQDYGGNIGPLVYRHDAHAWIGAELPLFGTQEFGFTLLQHYGDPRGYVKTQMPTDLALRYTLPFARGITVAVDGTNVFSQGFTPRAVRAWARVRI